jgi:hypothetical protein
VHDFNGGIGPNGLFWVVQVPDDAVTTSGDTLTISLTNVAIVDQISFPGNIFLGSTGFPATLSLNMTFQKSGQGQPRHVRPTSKDPLSPFTWAGEMSDATYKGTFSVAYNDGKFSATGNFGSTAAEQVFAEMGTERNGSFVRHEDEDQGDQGENTQAAAAAALANSVAGAQLSASATQPPNSPKWRGKVPLQDLFH